MPIDIKILQINYEWHNSFVIHTLQLNYWQFPNKMTPKRENALIFSYFILKFFKKMYEDQYGEYI